MQFSNYWTQVKDSTRENSQKWAGFTWVTQICPPPSPLTLFSFGAGNSHHQSFTGLKLSLFMLSDHLRSWVNEIFQGLKEGLKGHIQRFHPMSSKPCIFIHFVCWQTTQYYVWKNYFADNCFLYALKCIWEDTN